MYSVGLYFKNNGEIGGKKTSKFHCVNFIQQFEGDVTKLFTFELGAQLMRIKEAVGAGASS